MAHPEPPANVPLPRPFPRLWWWWWWWGRLSTSLPCRPPSSQHGPASLLATALSPSLPPPNLLRRLTSPLLGHKLPPSPFASSVFSSDRLAASPTTRLAEAAAAAAAEEAAAEEALEAAEAEAAAAAADPHHLPPPPCDPLTTGLNGSMDMRVYPSFLLTHTRPPAEHVRLWVLNVLLPVVVCLMGIGLSALAVADEV